VYPTPIFVAGPADPCVSDLSPARKRLHALVTGIGFGRIENLPIRNREPVLDPPPRILRTIKLDAPPRTESDPDKMSRSLKRQFVEMFLQVDRLSDGTVLSIEIQNGLPVKMTVEEGRSQPTAALNAQHDGDTR
jgi:hypothetical protein